MDRSVFKTVPADLFMLVDMEDLEDEANVVRLQNWSKKFKKVAKELSFQNSVIRIREGEKWKHWWGWILSVVYAIFVAIVQPLRWVMIILGVLLLWLNAALKS